MDLWRHRILGFAYRFNVIFLGLLFLTSGMGKLYADHRFPGLMGPPWLEEAVAEYGLSFFARFIAFTQIITGYLMATWLFRRLGSVLLAPMLVGILFLTISLEWRGTPFVVGLFILQLTQIFWHDRKQYLHLITGEMVPDAGLRIRGSDVILVLSGLIMMISSVFVSPYAIVLAWCISAIGLFMGAWAGWRFSSRPVGT